MKNSKRNILTVIGFVLLIVIFIITIILTNLAHKTNCTTNNPSTAFGIQPDTSAVDNSNSFKNVTGLGDAQEQCLSNNNCKSFIYNEKDLTMKVVELKSLKISKPGTHLLTLQMGVQVT